MLPLRRTRYSANLAIDSKLRSCDLVTLRVRDVCTAPDVEEVMVAIDEAREEAISRQRAREAALAGED